MPILIERKHTNRVVVVKWKGGFEREWAAVSISKIIRIWTLDWPRLDLAKVETCQSASQSIR